MLKIGLTGSIGMGKSTTAALFARHGIPVYDSDDAVHRLYGPGGAAVAPVGALFPEAIMDGRVDRTKLAAAVLENAAAMAKLEAIIHPLVQADQAAWLEARAAEGADMAVADIPLLFETGAEHRFDRIVVVSAPAEIQRDRVLARTGMTEEKFAALLAKQMPDEEKRRRADAVIETGSGLRQAEEQVAALVGQWRAERHSSA